MQRCCTISDSSRYLADCSTRQQRTALDDYALIQSHPREGAALLNPYRFLYEAARLIAHHHERWDGAGYPYGLRGAYIPLAARILAIADVFDSIANPIDFVTQRPTNAPSVGRLPV
jgi:HD-GYP domain-containing protein (c-di-GMP phosphodiesterase class II)